ncbi:MAG: cytochrome c [Thermodesulfobacteriota bacterium]
MIKIQKKPLLLCLVISIATIGGYSKAGQSPGLETGKKLYAEHCAECHGENAVGQDPKRRADGLDDNKVPISPALNGTAYTWHHSPKLLSRYIDKGSIMRGSPMPTFGSELNEQEIQSIISYFQSLWSEKRRQWYFEKYKE